MTIPLFDLYTLEILARRTGYTMRYLLDVATYPQKLNPRFRRICCQRLRRSEEELFGPPPRSLTELIAPDPSAMLQ